MKPEDLVPNTKYYLTYSGMLYDKHDGNKFLDGSPIGLKYSHSAPSTLFSEPITVYVFYILDGPLKGRDTGLRLDGIENFLIPYNAVEYEKIESIDEFL